MQLTNQLKIQIILAKKHHQISNHCSETRLSNLFLSIYFGLCLQYDNQKGPSIISVSPGHTVWNCACSTCKLGQLYWGSHWASLWSGPLSELPQQSFNISWCPNGPVNNKKSTTDTNGNASHYQLFFVCLFFKTSLGTSESHFAKSGRSRMTTGVVCDLVLAGAQSSLACLLVSRPSTMVPVTSGKDLEKRAIRLCSGKRATEVEPFF